MNAIEVRGLSKQYTLGEKKESYRTLRDTLAGLGSFGKKRGPRSTMWALKDVSFEVKPGEAVGLIGRNGAGKSTLLKVLSRITEPTEGYADFWGRVGSLLEVGTGFHPELSGRENVYLNGAILGMTQKEIDRKFDEIVAFSEVEEFVDTPVKHYSSGMYLRMAFAVAAHLETEILLIDEVLAVGDAQFQRKCLGKMSEVAGAGRTVIFVSHNMLAISRLCSRAIMLDGGRVKADGPADQVVDEYMRQALDREGTQDLSAYTAKGFRLKSAVVRAGGGESAGVVRCGDDVELVFSYEAEEPLNNARIRFTVTDSGGAPLFLCNSRYSRGETFRLPLKGDLSLRIPRLPLLPGTYLLTMSCAVDDTTLARFEDFMQLEVVPGDFFGTGQLPPARGGSIVVDHSWSVSDGAAAAAAALIEERGVIAGAGMGRG